MYICGELAGIRPNSCRGLAEPKKCPKTPCLLAPWPSAETIIIRLEQDANMILLRGGEDMGRNIFLRDDQKNVKRVGGP
jgi:hypothetical protein